MSTEELIAKIKSDDDNVRGDAWQNAGDAGPDAVKPLAEVMAEGGMEVSRAAKRAIWKIVRHVGRPGAGDEKKPVVKELTALLVDGQPVAVRREVLWMLSEIADSPDVIREMARLIGNRDLREDARMAIERIPGEHSLAALEKALGEVPADFKIHIAQSLRARGQTVPGLPCRKLVPAKEKRA